jgi:hypothetical protein
MGKHRAIFSLPVGNVDSSKKRIDSNDCAQQHGRLTPSGFRLHASKRHPLQGDWLAALAAVSAEFGHSKFLIGSGRGSCS